MEEEKVVESVSTISELLVRHGSDIVITSIFLTIFILVGLYFIKHQQTISNKILTEHERLLNILIEERKGIRKNKRYEYGREATVFEKWRRMNQFIQDHLNLFINDIKYRRIGIYLFHNGQTSLNGFPFIKFSCISEKCINFYDSKMKEHKDIPVNLMDNFILDMSKGIQYITDDGIGYSDNLSDLIFMKMLCDSTDNFIIESLYEKDIHNLVGFIVVEFNHGDLNANNINAYSEVVKNIAKAIVLLFAYFNNIKTDEENESNNDG